LLFIIGKLLDVDCGETKRSAAQAAQVRSQPLHVQNVAI